MQNCDGRVQQYTPKSQPQMLGKTHICAVGQTVAAQNLCTAFAPCMKNHYIQTGVGHCGVFSG